MDSRLGFHDGFCGYGPLPEKGAQVEGGYSKAYWLAHRRGSLARKAVEKAKRVERDAA